MGRFWTVRGSIGGGVLVALLLTGCGNDDDGAAASPASAPSAGAATSETPSPGATPADYVPASLDGPAQNVPKPVMPELAKEESREGAQAFLDYWSDAMWYAYQTGDTSYARDIISPSCEVCVAELDDLEDVYAEGKWTVGGRESINLQDDQITIAADGVYKPMVIYQREKGQLINRGRVEIEGLEEPGDMSLVYLDFNNNGWTYITLAPVPGEQ